MYEEDFDEYRIHTSAQTMPEVPWIHHDCPYVVIISHAIDRFVDKLYQYFQIDHIYFIVTGDKMFTPNDAKVTGKSYTFLN